MSNRNGEQDFYYQLMLSNEKLIDICSFFGGLEEVLQEDSILDYISVLLNTKRDIVEFRINQLIELKNTNKQLSLRKKKRDFK